MSDPRGYLSEALARRDEEKAARIAANTSAAATSLGELARLRFRESEQTKADALAAKQQKQRELRTEYLRLVAAEGLRDLPRLLAEKWELPEGHPFVTGLHWVLITEPYEGAVFTETNTDGKPGIKVEAAHDRRLEEKYQTLIDGHRIEASIMRLKNTEPSVTVSGVSRHMSRGLTSLAALGEFLEEPVEQGA